MPATVVVGGQYGGEGKGKTVAFLAQRLQPKIVVRCGGPNSGHTVSDDRRTRVLRMIPAAYECAGARLLLAPGCLIDPDILLSEAKQLGLDPVRLGVDFRSTVIEPTDREQEVALSLRDRFGSTLCGVGSAVARRALRDRNLRHAEQVDSLRPFICDVSAEVDDVLADGERVIVEGTQGFGLSIYHSRSFPFVTSRDTTASAFLSEVGIGPTSTDGVVVVARTFPIRVGGNSGPLRGETSWEAIRQACGSPAPIDEMTTVTKRQRRVGLFDLSLVQDAVRYNGATGLVVNGLDLLNYQNRGVHEPQTLTCEAVKFLREVEERTEIPVLLGGTGPETLDFVDWNEHSLKGSRPTLAEAM